MISKNFNWLKDVLLPLAVCVMEIAWVYPVVLWVGSWQFLAFEQPALSALSMLGIVAVGAFATRFLLRRPWGLNKLRAAIVGLGIVTLFAAIAINYGNPTRLASVFSFSWAPAMALAVGAYLWWRGIGIGRISLHFEETYGYFLTGFLALVSLLFLSLTSQGSEGYKSLSQAGLYVIAFFFSSLIALSLARLEMIRQESHRKEGGAISLSRHWLAMLLTTVSSMVMVALLAASLISFDLVAKLAGPLGLLADGLFNVLYFLLLPLGYLVELLIYVLRFFVALLNRGQTPQLPQTPDFSDFDRLRQQVADRGMPAEVLLVIKWLVLALLTALALFLLVRAVFRYRAVPDEEEIEEIHESLWSWKGALAVVLARFRQIWETVFHRIKVPTRQPAPRPQPFDPEFRLSFSIREIYRTLLLRAKQIGFPRHSYETPYEYLVSLKGRMSYNIAEVEEITEAYVRVRYSGLPSTKEELDMVARSWARVDKLFRLLAQSTRIDG